MKKPSLEITFHNVYGKEIYLLCTTAAISNHINEKGKMLREKLDKTQYFNLGGMISASDVKKTAGSFVTTAWHVQGLQIRQEKAFRKLIYKASNILHKQSRRADNGFSTRGRVWQEVIDSSHQENCMMLNVTQYFQKSLQTR
jgi:hypothetical protein